ncbi:MAG: hypothetical protein AAF206_01520 [Bacteroidota bacterium]
MPRLQQFLKRHGLLSFVLLVQLILLLYTFRGVVFSPSEHMLCNWNDGMRQYFFYQSYVDQAPELGWSKVYSMGYPFGEYIMFTDCTPLLAVPVKFVSHYIIDLSEAAIPIFNYFIVLGRLLSTLLLILILRRLKVHPILLVVFAVCLPWLNMEILKITQGHLNLSLSWPLLGTIYLAQSAWGQLREPKALRKTALRFAVFVMLAGCVHLYWLAMCTVVMGFFLLAVMIKEWRTNRLRMIQTGLLACILPWIIMGTVVRLHDGYFADRKAHGEGYGWHHWRLNFSGLYTSHEHNSIPFVFENQKLNSHGSYAYLGSFVMFGLLVWLGARLMRGNRRLRLRDMLAEDDEGQFILLLGVGSMVSLMISLGERIPLFNHEYLLTNYLNLFYYIHLFTDRITQFRDVSRFSFVFFWFVNLLAIFFLDRSWKRIGRNWVIFLGLGLMLLTVIDTRDAIRNGKKWMVRDNVFHPDYESEMDDLIRQINPQDYQAMIPIPYNHEGAGDNHFVIDGFDDLTTATMQFQQWSEIPLMSAKFARGNFQHAQILQSLFTPDSLGGISPELMKNLDDRPILVLQQTDFYTGKRELSGNQLQPAWDILNRCHEIIEAKRMTKIATAGPYVLWRWDVGKK